MYSLLDSIIEGQSSGPRMVSEEHNVSKINWVRGMSDPGEMIGCGKYQELRRHAGETDSAYQARLIVLLAALPADVRAKIEAFGQAAAIKRAGLDTTGGRVRMMSAGALPWHGLGVNVESAVNARDCRRLAGLDWTVGKRPLYFQVPGGAYVESKSAFSIVREDTQEELGTVGGRYKPIQNDDATDFLDSVIGEFGAKYETAGSLFNGSKIWFLINLPEQGFTINGGDEQLAYGLLENPHDGSGCGFFYPTATRAVCANTVRLASKDRYKGLKIRHTGDIKSKVRDARAAFGYAVHEFAEYKGQAEALYRKPLAVRPYVENVLDQVLEVTQAEALKGADALAAAIATTQANREIEAKRIQRQIDKRGEVLADIIERYESERCGVGDIRGTAWAAFNAVSEHADHNTLGRKQSASHRFESLLTGPADEMKQVAFATALAV